MTVTAPPTPALPLLPPPGPLPPAVTAAATPTATAAVTSLGAPVDPDRDTARRWALEELSRPEYARAEPSLLERGLEWLSARLDELLSLGEGLGPGAGLAVGVALVLAAVAVALVVAGPVRRTARARRRDGVLAESVLGAAEHRALATAAADRGDWTTATRERFRAAARSLEERTVLDPRPGRTAHEVAREGGRELPGAAGPLAAAAAAFDNVTYGERPGTEAGYQRTVAADDAAARTRPVSLATSGQAAR